MANSAYLCRTEKIEHLKLDLQGLLDAIFSNRFEDYQIMAAVFNK